MKNTRTIRKTQSLQSYLQLNMRDTTLRSTNTYTPSMVNVPDSTCMFFFHPNVRAFHSRVRNSVLLYVQCAFASVKMYVWWKRGRSYHLYSELCKGLWYAVIATATTFQ